MRPGPGKRVAGRNWLAVSARGTMKNAMEILGACLMVGLICLPTLRNWLGKLSD